MSPRQTAAGGARRGLGALGENLAARHLAGAGYRLVARNWRCGIGEIDLVVCKGDRLSIVEVRTRRGEALGSPEESITAAKRARLAALADAYVTATGWEGGWQIDVVAVALDSSGRLLRIDHYDNAVSG